MLVPRGLPRGLLFMTFQEWLQSTRLGLDFGPKGVGVGVVRRTSVLFAQSFLNLGASELETRRGHRRSRRTHRMRQRRLRRFRQYCLTHTFQTRSRWRTRALLRTHFWTNVKFPTLGGMI
ncbi:MAG: RRXRR domain-containing protein [Deltaproteobacteria bacterium]|nr:RRXRR domain-containing protein [Deltaproteobacteria bacterium]